MSIADPPDMMVAGDPVDPTTTWVRREIVIEVQYTAWSGAGRVRHAVYLGVREDKAAEDVVRDLADPEAPRAPVSTCAGRPDRDGAQRLARRSPASATATKGASAGDRTVAFRQHRRRPVAFEGGL